MWELDSILGANALDNPNFANTTIANIETEYSKQTTSLLRRLLAPEPENRPTLQFLMKKRYIKQWAPAPGK